MISNITVTPTSSQGLFSEPHHSAHEPEGSRTQQHDADTTAALRAHHLWLAFLLELWATTSSRGGADSAAAAGMLLHVLQRSLADPSLLSMHPLAVGARFRLLQLALRCAAWQLQQAQQQQAQQPLDLGDSSVAGDVRLGAAAQPSAAALGGVLLQERAIRAGLLWFKGRPDFYHRSSLRHAEEAYQSIQVGLRGQLRRCGLHSSARRGLRELC